MSLRKHWVLYATFVIALWIFVPELRRIADWRVGGGIGTMLAIVPLASMLPCLSVMRGRLTEFPTVIFITMFAAISYASVVGIVSSNGIAPVLFTFADFLLPMAFGLWVARCAIDDSQGFSKLVRAAFVMLAVSSAYGIWAYAAVPPWIKAWLATGTMVSTGVAEPFQFRVFGTMNGPGIFGTFAALVLILNFSPAVKRHRLDVLAAAVCVIAVGLSLNRSAWVALTLALIVYVGFSPLRAKLVRALAVMAVSVVIAGGLLMGTVEQGNVVLNGFLSRVQTLGDVGNDYSAVDRANQIAEAFNTGVNAPVGLGLGVFGTASQANAVNGDSTILDSGYLARFDELGWFGSLGMALALAMAVGCGAVCTIFGKRFGATKGSLICSLFAVQIAMLWFNVSGDLLRAGSGSLFWIATFMLAGFATAPSGESVREWAAGSPAGAH